MANYISKLHPEGNTSDTIYPDWIKENSPLPVLYNYGTISSGDIFERVDKPGIYFLSSNEEYSNLPAGVESGVIISATTENSDYQKYIILVDYQTGYMYQANMKGPGVFSTWKKFLVNSDLPISLTSYGTLPDNTDIFEYTLGKTGIWYLSSHNSYSNFPKGVFGGMLISYSDVTSPSTRTYLQVFDANSDLVFYSHTYNNTNTPWSVLKFGGVITKVDDSTFSISNNKVVTTLKRVKNTNKHQDAWNITGLSKLDFSILSTGTDILGPIQELGQSDFSGGVHGHEIGTSLKIFTDGVEFTGTTSTYRQCDVIIESDIYRADEDVITFKRKIHITFIENKIVFEVAYRAVNNILVYRATNGGLYAETANHINYLFNNVDGIVNLPVYSTFWNNKYVSFDYFLSSDTHVHIRNIYGNQLPTYSGALNRFSKETPQRYKVYMDIISANSSGTQISAGEVIYGSWEMIIT